MGSVEVMATTPSVSSGAVSADVGAAGFGGSASRGSSATDPREGSDDSEGSEGSEGSEDSVDIVGIVGSVGGEGCGGTVADGWRATAGSPGTSESPASALAAAVVAIGDTCGEASVGDRSVTFFSGLPSASDGPVFNGGGARFDSCCCVAVGIGLASAADSEGAWEGACEGASFISWSSFPVAGVPLSSPSPSSSFPEPPSPLSSSSTLESIMETSPKSLEPSSCSILTPSTPTVSDLTSLDPSSCGIGRVLAGSGSLPRPRPRPRPRPFLF